MDCVRRPAVAQPSWFSVHFLLATLLSCRRVFATIYLRFWCLFFFAHTNYVLHKYIRVVSDHSNRNQQYVHGSTIMASSSHFRSDATLGMSHYGGDALALEKILGKLNINDGISPKIVDEMAMALKGRLNINVNDEFTRNMAMNVIEERLKTMRVSTATTTSSPPPRHQSPRRANSSRDIPGCLPQQLRRPPSPRPNSPLPRAFKVATSQDSRGRSPSRSRSSGAKVKDQSRSITPNRNVFFGRMKPSVAPETTNTGNAATSNTNRSSSRSPRRGRSQSPLQRIFGGNGATRYEMSQRGSIIITLGVL